MVTVIAEISGNSLHPVTAQLVGAAGGDATVLCPGGVGASDAATLSGVAKVISVEGDCFATFDGGAWASALGSVAEGRILAASTARGREIAARMGAAKGVAVVQDVTSISGKSVSRPIYSGKAMESLTVQDDTILTLRPNTFPAAQGGGSAAVSTVNQSADVSTSVKEAIAKASERLDVADADIIISGGENVSSIEIEDVLYRHPAVLEAAVVARPDNKWGETPCAFVTLKLSASHVNERTLIEFCRNNMAHYKSPKTIIFGGLPKTSTGKVQKFKLREQANALGSL